MLTRSIIINQHPTYYNLGQKNIRGLLTITGDSIIKGHLKVFNINKKNLVFLLSIGNSYYNFDIKNPMAFDFEIKSVDINADIVAVLCCKEQDEMVLIAGGSSKGTEYDVDDLLTHYKNLCHNAVVSNSQSQVEQITQEPTHDESSVPTYENTFYNLIQPQLEELFSKFPHFTPFENMVENTEWIKVNFDTDSSNHYIMGKLYQGENVAYLCYGIPADSQKNLPPSNLIKYCQWIPLDQKNPEAQGYWVMYQDAVTGENVNI